MAVFHTRVGCTPGSVFATAQGICCKNGVRGFANSDAKGQYLRVYRNIKAAPSSWIASSPIALPTDPDQISWGNALYHDNADKIWIFGVKAQSFEFPEGTWRWKDATLAVAWPEGDPAPEAYQLVLPARAAGGVLDSTKFAGKFGKTCAEQASTSVDLFYHYRPEEAACPLAPLTRSASAESEVATIEGVEVLRAPLFLAKREPPAERKAPEYARMWQDRKLVVTSVIAKDEEGSSEAP
jgi:hypothetical protein